MDDPYNLQRFVDAQAPVIEQVWEELRRGRKTSHWMWFVFPQLKGLGHSWMAAKYAISSLAEADAYLRHSILGPRLIKCTRLVNSVDGRSVHQIFGSPDDMKFRSSMTLFGQVAGANEVFSDALERYFHAQPDPATISLLVHG